MLAIRCDIGSEKWLPLLRKFWLHALLAIRSGEGPSATMLDDVFRHVEPQRSLGISILASGFLLLFVAVKSMRSLGGKDPAVNFVNFLNPLRSLGFHVSPNKRVDFPEPL